MEITVLIIIALRLIVPLLIVRFPLTGLLAAGFLDVIDFSIIGSHNWYQVLDKLLDLYYLSLCLYVVLKTWRDPIARHLAVGLFAFRMAGVGVLLLGVPEWSLLFFPNLFEMLFGFYTLYRLWSREPILFRRRRDVSVVMTVLAIPKLVQEYGLHIYVPHPELTPPIIVAFATLPAPLGALAWLTLPIATLWYYSRQSHRVVAPKPPQKRPGLGGPRARHV